MRDRFAGMLGLAMKAGAVSSGEFAAEKSVKGGVSELVILADDASAGTKKKFMNMCDYYGVQVLIHSSKEDLGAALGKEERSVVSVTDRGFAGAIIKLCGKKEVV